MATSKSINERLDECLAELNRMSEEECEQFARNFEDFCEKRIKERKVNARKFLNETIFESKSVSTRTKNQVLNIIEQLDMLPDISVGRDGVVFLEYNDVFAGYICFALCGSEHAFMHFDIPEGVGNEEIKADNILTWIKDFYGEREQLYNSCACPRYEEE